MRISATVRLVPDNKDSERKYSFRRIPETKNRTKPTNGTLVSIEKILSDNEALCYTFIICINSEEV